MSLIQSLTQGGQIWAHRVRMFRQVLKLALYVSFLIGIVAFIIQMLEVDTYLMFSSWYYLKANLLGPFVSKVSVDKGFWRYISNEAYLFGGVEVEPKTLSNLCRSGYEEFLSLSLTKMGTSSTISSYAFGGILAFFTVRGGLSRRKKYLSNNNLISPIKAKYKIKLARKASSITLAGVPLIKGKENQHLLISGGTGSGKTNCLHHILPQLRRERKKTLIVDTTGVFVEKYYREGKDFFLNLFDERSSEWNPWVECRETFDFDSLAESFIPSSIHEGEHYWRQSSQKAFSALLEKLKREQKASMLSKIILHDSLEDFTKYISGTKAASVVDIASEKTAASVRSVLSSYLSSFEYLKDCEESFSIRDWLEQKDDSWLFLSSTPSQRSSMLSFLSSWLSIAIRGLFNLTPSFSRQIWFVVDELPSLHRLKDFESFITEARKYGGCGVFSVQSPIQIERIYGREASEVIIGNCGTKLAFCERDFKTASKISEFFGEGEVREFQEGISYGAHEMRDGVNLSSHKKISPTVSATNIQSLKSNQAFVKLPENFPTVKLKFSIKT